MYTTALPSSHLRALIELNTFEVECPVLVWLAFHVAILGISHIAVRELDLFPKLLSQTLH